MADKLELYHHGSSVCAAKVRFYLAEKDLPWEGHYIDILKGEQFAPEYIKLNPKAVVPTLLHNGTVIRDSTNICEYLDDAYPEPSLKPEAAFERARMRQWTKRLDEIIHFYTGVLSGSIAFRHQHLARPADESPDDLLHAPWK